MLLPLLQNNLLTAATGNTLDAVETGSDTLVASGQVVVKGVLDAQEAGADTFAASGTVSFSAVTGTLAATEAGADTSAATGKVILQGGLIAAEAGSDTLIALGQIVVKGDVSGSEAGADTFDASGLVTSNFVIGLLDAVEDGADFCAITNVMPPGAIARARSNQGKRPASQNTVRQAQVTGTRTPR